MKIRKLGLLTWATIAMVALNAATNPALLVAYHLSPDLYELHAYSDMGSMRADMAMLLWTLLTMFVFGWWLLRAGGNLAALGFTDLEYTPAARIWWFFVPFANLVIPYFAMRELWNASHGKPDLGDTPSLIATWWALWLFNNFGLIILGVLAGPFELVTIVWIQTVTGIMLAGIVIPMLLGIARAQAAQHSPSLSDVFV